MDGISVSRDTKLGGGQFHPTFTSWPQFRRNQILSNMNNDVRTLYSQDGGQAKLSYSKKLCQSNSQNLPRFSAVSIW